jgi:hypothetical protein
MRLATRTIANLSTLTLDGNAAKPYVSPSPTQRSAIDAGRGEKLYRMTRR